MSESGRPDPGRGAGASPESAALTIERTRRGAVTLLALTGTLSIGGGDADLRRAFRELLDAGERALVLDLRGVSAMDSAGLGEIVACHKRARAAGANLGLVIGRESRIHGFFRTAQLGRVFEIFEGPDEAESALAGRAPDGPRPRS